MVIPRTIAQPLALAARQYPVVSLTGCRQSGKTTLIRDLFPDYEYVLLENKDTREYAQIDPRGFLNQFRDGVIIDEAQRVPDLFSYIQGIVDEKKGNGQFILSGSQNFLLLEAISQTLAGRVAIFHLLPFSRAELAKRPGLDILNPGLEKKVAASGENLFTVLFKGSYPRIHDQSLPPRQWLDNYYQTYLERDVRSIVNVGDLETFSRFVGLCAGRSGQLLDKTSLGNDAGVTHTTVSRWLSILEASFIIYILRPYHKNFGKRLIKRPKIYFLDTGLLCFLLNIHKPEDIRTHALRGSIFETFVLSEFCKYFYHQGTRQQLFFWRDSSANEIDFLLENGNTLLGYEAKSSETFSKSFVTNLNKDFLDTSSVIYGGDKSFSFSGHQIHSWQSI